MQRYPLLLVGDFDSAELAPIADALSAACDAKRAGSIGDSLALLATAARSPVAIVMAWPTPGAFVRSELSALRKTAPLARQFAVLGSWCEGQTRGGQMVPGLIRTVWHQWLPTWLDEFRAGRPSLPTWGLPETAGEEERLLARVSRPWVPRSGLVVIIGRQQERATLLAQACRQRGYTTVWLQSALDLLRVGDPTVILWDGDARQLDELNAVRCATKTPILALIDFPRVDDVRRASAAGATAIVGRPMSWECLYWHIDQVTTVAAAKVAARATPQSVRAG